MTFLFSRDEMTLIILKSFQLLSNLSLGVLNTPLSFHFRHVKGYEKDPDN